MSAAPELNVQPRGLALYQIPFAIEQVFVQVADILDSECTEMEKNAALEALERQLAGIEMARDAKCLYLARKYKSLYAEFEAIDHERRRLDARAKANERQAESIKAYIAGALPAGEKVSDATTQIGWRKSEGVVLKVRAEDLPTKFQRIKIEASITALKEALKTGDATAEAVAQLEPRQNVQIR